MLSIGRLGRRAPAWRLTLFASAAFTLLAAMFPPATPPWLHRAALPMAVPAVVPAREAAHFVPQPDPPPPTYTTSEQPPPGNPRSGVIPVAGRQMPLPEGGWRTVLIGRTQDPPGMQIQVLARIVDRALTGLMAVTTSDAVGTTLPPALVLQPCNTTNALAAEAIPTSPDDPFLHECWTLTSQPVSLERGPCVANQISLPGLDRMKALGLTLPTRGLALRYSRSDQLGWLGVMVVLPDNPATAPAERRRLATWAHRYAQLLHRGYDGQLPQATVVKDPA